MDKLTESKKRWSDASKERFTTAKLLNITFPILHKIQDKQEKESEVGRRPGVAELIHIAVCELAKKLKL